MLTTISAFGQHLNFPDSNAIWSVYNEKYFVDGDSTFNSIDYKKYYMTYDTIVPSGNFYALLREDTILKKVYSIGSGKTQERLLYDFSLSINDTISVYPLSFPYFSGSILIKVDFIDSILIDGNYHKRLKISGVNENTGYDEYWIEGIGSTMGIFNSGITGVVIFDSYYPTLLCFEKDGALLYSNPLFTSCRQNLPTGIKDNSLDVKTKLFPNPATNTVFIKSDNVIKSYKIKSLQGQTIEQLATNTNLLSIDISKYTNGIYLITLITDKGTTIKKLMKNGL